MILALIPAGGKSTRMGRPKLALPLGEKTVLEHVVHALRRGGVEQVLVVIGPHVPELVPLAEAAGAQTLLLPHETPDMRATVEAGLRWLEDHYRPQPGDLWLLVPGDHPTLDPAVVRRLLDAQRQHAGCSILLPCFHGKRGHPTLIQWRHVAAIRKRPVEEGINVYLRAQASETLEVPVATESVLVDLDTPEDFEYLCRQLR